MDTTDTEQGTPKSLQADDQKVIAVAMTLRAFHNECLSIMAEEENGDIDMNEAMDKFQEVDGKFARVILNTLQEKPKSSLFIPEVDWNSGS